MTGSGLPAPSMTRLAFIHLLHQQGLEQSREPSPMNFACVLTFHDAIEMFLLLTAEHLGVPINDRAPGGFVARYFDGLHPNKHPDGVELAGRPAVQRLTDLRNSFKHAHTWPGPDAVEAARADTVAFFEENTPKVFGVAYDAIDIVDLIPQPAVRDLVKKGEELFPTEPIESMACLVDAFDELFTEHVGHGWDRSPFAFGATVKPMSAHKYEAVLHEVDSRTHQVDTSRRSGSREVAAYLTKLTETVQSLQAALRVMTLGVDYSAYLRFRHLTPEVTRWSGRRDVAVYMKTQPYEPTEDDFRLCRTFVINVAIRQAEMRTHFGALLAPRE